MRIVALDLIRFFAAMSVVLYHYISPDDLTHFPVLSQITDFGYLGVPLFFIISGYVIALSANNRSAWQFISSRFVRLYPALWAGIFFTVIVVTLLSDIKISILQILANATLLNDYMGFANIDGVYWTLKAELKFYACMSILLLVGVFRHYKVWVSIWMLMVVCFALFNEPFFMGWFISPEYSSFFIAGICYYLIQSKQNQTYAKGVLFSSLIMSLYNAYGQIPHFVSDPSQSHKILTLLIILLFYVIFFRLSEGKLTLKANSLYTQLGALTYPLYLIHSLAGKLIIAKLSPYMPMELIVILVITLMIFVAYLIHKYVECKVASPLKRLLLTQSFSRKKGFKN